MTTNHHTAISTGAAANAATINSPLSQLDSAIPTGTIAVLGSVQTFTAKQTFQIGNPSASPVAGADDLTLEGTDASGVGMSILTTDSIVAQLAFGSPSAGAHARVLASYNSGSPYLALHANSAERVRIDNNGRVGIGTSSPGSLLELNLSTEDLEIVDAGSAAATEQDWIEVQVGGVTGYLRVFASK